MERLVVPPQYLYSFQQLIALVTEHSLVFIRIPVFPFIAPKCIEERAMTFKTVFIISRLILRNPTDQVLKICILLFSAAEFLWLPLPCATMGNAHFRAGIQEDKLITLRENRLNDVRITSLDDPTRIHPNEGLYVCYAVGQRPSFCTACKRNCIE